MKRSGNTVQNRLLNLRYALRRRFFCTGDEPKPGLARGLGDRLQSRNVPLGTSGDLFRDRAKRKKGQGESRLGTH